MRKLPIFAVVSLVALYAAAGVLHISVKAGTVEGGTYSNPSLGITYRIPEGWAGTIPASAAAATHEFPLLQVLPAGVPQGERMAALVVIAQKFLPEDQREDPAKFLTAAELAQRGAFHEARKRESLRPPYQYDVDGHPFFRAEWRLAAGLKDAAPLYETQVAGIVNGHILLLSAVSPRAEEANELADSAADLSFAPPVTNDDPDAPPIIIQRKETPVKRVSVTEKEMRAHLRSKVEPQYPNEARERGVEGEVLLDVLVGADGNVEDATVLSGHPLLTDAALTAVRQWKFEPVEVDGVPSEAETKIRVTFALISARSSS